ncbi:MAG TPA: hypothetical protein VF821_35435 [Lentzea sp.]
MLRRDGAARGRLTWRTGDDWGRRLPAAQSRSAVTLVLISQRTGDAVYEVEEIATAIELARRSGDPVQPVYR